MSARDVIGGKNFLIAYDRVHNSGEVLPASIGVSQTQRVADLMQKNAANIGNHRTIMNELQWPTI